MREKKQVLRDANQNKIEEKKATLRRCRQRELFPRSRWGGKIGRLWLCGNAARDACFRQPLGEAFPREKKVYEGVHGTESGALL